MTKENPHFLISVLACMQMHNNFSVLPPIFCPLAVMGPLRGARRYTMPFYTIPFQNGIVWRPVALEHNEM